ncbi:MAG: acyltransferase [Actinomycetota bacterium]|nr:acyltransferase [Actinomycetota bacterium]
MHPSPPATPVPGGDVADPTAKPRVVVPALDGFRGLAALTVVLYHVVYGAGLPQLGNGSLRDVFMSGYMGVDFFFVISGFVLFLPTVLAHGRFGSVRAYGIRRAARIIPAYYVVLVAVVVLQPLLSKSDTPLPWDGGAGAFSFLLHLSFLQHSLGLLRGYPEGFLVMGVVWTLTLEAMFYVVLPLVASWYFRHPIVGFFIALAASMVWRLTVVHASFTVGWLPATASPNLLRLILVTQFPTFLAQFAAGMTAAWLFVRWRTAQQRWVPWAAVGAQVVAAVTIVWRMRSAGLRDMTATNGTYSHWTATLPIALAFGVLMLATVLAPRWAQSPVANRASRGLGDISYGVYLWHLLIIGFVVTTVGFDPNRTTGAFLTLFAVTLGGSLVLATLSLVFVERPCIRWARRCSRRIERSSRPRGDTVGEPVEVVTPANAW